MSENFPSINLVKNKQIPFLDKLFNWALTVGRLIVIITEIVAVAAFVYRFSLDEKLVNLHSAVKQKQVLVSLLKNEENTYRNLQGRIALASTLSARSVKVNRIIHNIISTMLQETKINDLTLNNDRITMSTSASSSASLTNIVNSLKSYPDIKSVSIDNIESKPAGGLLVNITAMLR